MAPGTAIACVNVANPSPNPFVMMAATGQDDERPEVDERSAAQREVAEHRDRPVGGPHQTCGGARSAARRCSSLA